MYYVLRNRKPVAVADVITWGIFFQNMDNRRVARSVIEQPEHDPVTVSTVFLGMDHGWGDGPPLLFESMVFGGPLNEQCYRYSTWEEAEAGHAILADEATIEGRVAAWEVREKLKALGEERK